VEEEAAAGERRSFFLKQQTIDCGYECAAGVAGEREWRVSLAAAASMLQ
jgi:hypothetical protein